MNKNEKLTLIEGVFSKEEAKDILINIFSEKIKFHQFKNFSSQERDGKEDEIAQQRIPALKQELIKVLEFLAEAKDKKLIISSEINISLSND